MAGAGMHCYFPSGQRHPLPQRLGTVATAGSQLCSPPGTALGPKSRPLPWGSPPPVTLQCRSVKRPFPQGRTFLTSQSFSMGSNEGPVAMASWVTPLPLASPTGSVPTRMLQDTSCLHMASSVFSQGILTWAIVSRVVGETACKWGSGASLPTGCQATKSPITGGGTSDAPGMLVIGDIVNTFTGGKLEWGKKIHWGTQYLRLLRDSGEGLIIRSGIGWLLVSLLTKTMKN